MLDAMIVGAEQVRNLGGIARAAHVFQKQGIKQGRAISRAKMQFLGHPHADQGRAHAVPLGIPLRNVERHGEGRDDLREANLGTDD